MTLRISSGIAALAFTLTFASSEAASSMTQALNKLTRLEQGEGWELLFDGNEAFGFRGYKQESMPTEGWVVDSGTLQNVAGAGAGDIVTRKKYRDFDFRFEWKVAPKANSGVIYHVTEDHGATYETGPEYQVLDDAGHANLNEATGAGALYGLFTSKVKALRAAGQWNKGRILVIGNRVEHWLNGMRVVNVVMHDDAWRKRVSETKFKDMPDFATRASGHIALQDHGDQVWYRAMKILPLDPVEDQKMAFGINRKLAGWETFERKTEGAVTGENQGWILEDGVIHHAGGRSGYLHTTASYGNFVLRFEVMKGTEDWSGQGPGVVIRRTGEHCMSPHGIELGLGGGVMGDLIGNQGYPMTGLGEDKGEGRSSRMRGPKQEAGRWIAIEMTAYRSELVVRIDGAIVNQAQGCMEVPGNIALRTAPGGTRFRGFELYRLGLDGYKGSAQKVLGRGKGK
ncbi:MAG: hypothetical protein ACI835_000386 [Planctomycetota bacterium]|jgi:hypothetical protein